MHLRKCRLLRLTLCLPLATEKKSFLAVASSHSLCRDSLTMRQYSSSFIHRRIQGYRFFRSRANPPIIQHAPLCIDNGVVRGNGEKHINE